jgi:hypothetical protein
LYLVDLGSPLLHCPVLGIGMGWGKERSSLGPPVITTTIFLLFIKVQEIRLGGCISM